MDREAPPPHIPTMHFELGEIESELAAMKQLLVETANVPKCSDIYARRARGSILHDFYMGAEHIFERITKLLNDSVADAANWDQQLLADMAQPIPGLRPAVINDDLRDRLAEYRLFRLSPLTITANDDVSLRRLEERLPKTMDDLQVQVRAFTAWLLGS